MKTPLYAPSMMSADLLHLEDCIRRIEPISDVLHFDIMDGHFAPSLTCSPDMIRAVRGATSLPLDAHLMVSDPVRFTDLCIAAGADYITLHAETIVTNAFRTISVIKAAGRKAGVALTPATPVSALSHYLDLVDLVTVMTVDIGYGGQKLIPQMLPKISELAAVRAERGLHFTIMTDGGVGWKTYRSMLDAGADMLVLGKGLFRPEMTLDESIERWADIKRGVDRSEE